MKTKTLITLISFITMLFGTISSGEILCIIPTLGTLGCYFLFLSQDTKDEQDAFNKKWNDDMSDLNH
jgi:hypothetical protein